jgi:hypothetical protein
MRKLGINTNILDNIIEWGEKAIHMVPRWYWTEERIRRHATRLLKQPLSDKETFNDLPKTTDDDANDAFELNSTEALKPAKYEKVKLDEYIQSECFDHLSDEEKGKL